MYFSRAFIASALAGLGTAAKSGNSTSGAAAAASPGSVPEGMVATHVIQVGGPNGSLAFSPDNIKANVGDLVQFQFHPKNHSVVQSTFDKPCVPIGNVMANATNAFFSGFMPSNASAGSSSQLLTYTIRVMDTKPMWYYCSQAKHCQDGMVGAINAATTGNKTMSAFKALAASAPSNITPGQGSSGSGSSSSGTGSGSGSGSGTSGGSGGASSTGGAGGSGAGGAGGASGTSSSSPAQQTGAASSLQDAARQSMFGLSVGALAAFMVL